MDPSSTSSRQTSGLYALPDLTAMGRMSKSHLYNLIARGHFPPPILRCGPRFTRWSSQQCDEWFSDPAAWIVAHPKDTSLVSQPGSCPVLKPGADTLPDVAEDVPNYRTPHKAKNAEVQPSSKRKGVAHV